ncbi:MAG: hypothetical protein KJZ78_18420 [Bryobacteraceae bacterium]|nr:hypothetical protein [Bryobacteraceae bacterium]
MSQADYARHRNVNRSHISRLVKRGILVMRGKLVDVAASDAVLDDKPVEQVLPESHGPRLAADSPAGAPQPGSFAQARTAEMVFRARLRKLEWETKSGKFLLTDIVKVKWYTIIRLIRDKLLAVPAKLAPQLAAMTDPAEIRDFLLAEIVAILKALQEEIRYQRS